jgi:hypothetical protein
MVCQLKLYLLFEGNSGMFLFNTVLVMTFPFAVTGIGADANRPPCKKAKLARLERKHQKLLKQGLSQEEADSRLKQSRPQQQEGKSLEEWLNEPLPANPAHRLRVITCCVLFLRDIEMNSLHVQYMLQ